MFDGLKKVRCKTRGVVLERREGTCATEMMCRCHGGVVLIFGSHWPSLVVAGTQKHMQNKFQLLRINIYGSSWEDPIDKFHNKTSTFYPGVHYSGQINEQMFIKL